MDRAALETEICNLRQALQKQREDLKALTAAAAA